MLVNKWINNSLSRFWLEHCELCGSASRTTHLLCQQCLHDVTSHPSLCQRCSLPVPGADALICGHCQKLPPPYQSVYSFALYEAPLDRMILKFKFQQKLALGHKLGLLMAQDIKRRQLVLPDVMLPVPLHPQRLRERGYNQALELARPIASLFKVPLDSRSCVRKKATCEQKGLSAKKRKSNLKGAFQVNGSFHDKRVVVIDDVMTTGSTVHELSQQLIKSGAKHVDVWVAARAVL